MPNTLRIPIGLRILLTLASFVVVVAGISAARPILVPVLLAVFLSITCAPGMRWLIRRRVPTPVAVLVAVLCLVGIGGTVVTVIGQSVYNFRDNLDTYKEPLQKKVATVTDRLGEAGIKIPKSFNTDYLVDSFGLLLSGLTELFGKGLFILFCFVFIALEASEFPNKISVIPGDTMARQERWNKILSETRRYVALKTIISLVTGLTIGVLLFLLGVPYPSVWALLAFLLNFIPNIGSIIAALPAILVTFITQDGATLAWVIGIYVCVNLGIGNIVDPRVMGKGLGLSALVVFLSLVFWGFVLGPVGMLLAAPLTMIVKIVLSASAETRWLAVLLSNEVVESRSV